ncbi:hypothetical protein PAAG_11039 [Paracoccidioides lutzii Pb01]|uniref:Uncharacterized protein n=1 Tax=Paracoccidioides lutzii (strain ATCC MYA-826 / Pb01) TaxID=502779 RepID=A0A0A2V7N0_PARBA|nr:hypothetical protein PAAG_11039 [Paracoccidioides lutzii Pb01]KGQ02090.1 hypothetical protein PAAG_11039 [Paracoccidioides lutzii Pb01]
MGTEEYHSCLVSNSKTTGSLVPVIATLGPCGRKKSRKNATQRSNNLIKAVDLAEWWLKTIDSRGRPRVLGHVERANYHGYHHATAEEEVHAKGGSVEECGCDVGDEEIG